METCDVLKLWKFAEGGYGRLSLVCLFIQLHTAALRLIVRSWLDVPTFVTRRLHASPRESAQRRKVELWARNVR